MIFLKCYNTWNLRVEDQAQNTPLIRDELSCCAREWQLFRFPRCSNKNKEDVMVDTLLERALILHQLEVAVFRKLEIVISNFRGLTSPIRRLEHRLPHARFTRKSKCTHSAKPLFCRARCVTIEIPPKKQNISKRFSALYVTCVARSQLKNATTHAHTQKKKKITCQCLQPSIWMSSREPQGFTAA